MGHNYEYISDENATCLADGTETGTCTRCNHEVRRTEEGSALGHNYEYTSNNDATCLVDGTLTGTCTRCGDKITVPDNGSALGHEYPDKWNVRSEATESLIGIQFKKCIRCDHEITQEIPKLEHRWISNNNGTHTCTNSDCGITEDCYPNSIDTYCEKCGYFTTLPLEIITESIDNMTKDQEFTQQLMTNISNYHCTWKLIDGELPSGIELSSKGVLSGIPTTIGEYTITVECTVDDGHKTQTTSKEFAITVSVINYTITFDPQEGTIDETTRIVAQGELIGELPVPVRDGYVFGGWFTASSGGLKIDENYTVASDTTLYARWGQGTNIEFGDATSTFNMQYDSDRTNYQNKEYTIYHRCSDGSTSNLITQVGIYSNAGNDYNMTAENNVVKLYIKVTNNGESGEFDIGFDCDSYVNNNDCVIITRIENGVTLGTSSTTFFSVTVPYETAIWIGKYSERVANRYNDVVVGSVVGKEGGKAGSSDDTGYAFTMKNIFITGGAYTILEVTFEKTI